MFLHGGYTNIAFTHELGHYAGMPGYHFDQQRFSAGIIEYSLGGPFRIMSKFPGEKAGVITEDECEMFRGMWRYPYLDPEDGYRYPFY